MEEKTLQFYVSGMHCKACVRYLESEISALPKIRSAKANLNNNTITVTGEFNATPGTLASDFTRTVEARGYRLSLHKNPKNVNWREFYFAVPIAAAFIGLFVALQKLGIVDLVSASDVTYPTALIVGIVASLSTCMAVVGGLLLSISATFAKEGRAAKEHLLFHIARLVSFFVLGGLVGMLGSTFYLNAGMTFGLGLLVALVMFTMGLNLLDLFDWAKMFQPAMPKFLSNRASAMIKLQHGAAPLLAGLATFFLPCGFTQSMQIYTLTTGSFARGGFTMLFFALGTLPVLALISISFFKLQNLPKPGLFFKAAGLVVIAFALFNLINSLAVIGILPPFFNL